MKYLYACMYTCNIAFNFPLDIRLHTHIQTEQKPQAAIQNEIHHYVSVKACHPIEQ